MVGAGARLVGRYRLDERIGVGGMGEVWRGADEVLGRTVAVKVMLPALLDQAGFVDRFRAEARTMANLNHPGVVDVYDYHSDDTTAFLVMEHVQGEALSRTLSRVGRLTAARTMALIAQAAEALQAAHDQGIVHRDVKPGNLMVRPDGTLVLTDFGIARSEVAAQLTVTGMVLGTAAYLSPEQAAGEKASAASDVYALGVVAYQCLAGRRPFEGDNPVELAMKHLRQTPPPLPPDTPQVAQEVVRRAMAKDPARRWPSATHFAAAARHAATNLTHPTAARPATEPPTSGAAPAAAATAAAYPAGVAEVSTQQLRYQTGGAAVGGRPSWVLVAAVVLGVIAVLLCAGLLGYAARLALDGELGNTFLSMITYAQQTEGPTTT